MAPVARLSSVGIGLASQHFNVNESIVPWSGVTQEEQHRRSRC